MHTARPLAAFIVCVFALTSVASATEADKTLQNTEDSGLAIQGYDPVAYFTQGKAVEGSPDFVASHDGATYRFASAEHRDLFAADPAKYAPQFGGYCAYGVAKGKLFKIDPEAFNIVDGRLLMQFNAKVARTFAKDAQAYLEKADGHWPDLVAEHGE